MAKILSVEDDADLQHLIGRVLYQEGYEMYYAWNGREGWSKILEFKPDLLLLDLMLPVMNGLELMREVRNDKRTHGLPVIIVTTFGDEAGMLKEAVEQLGASTYLRKPVQLSELVKVVKRTLDKTENSAARASRAAELKRGCLRADPGFMTVWIDDRLVATLPNKEFLLLQCLMERQGPAKKSVLMRALDYDQKQDDALKQVVHRLRAALGPVEGRRIKRAGDGYELVS